MGAATAEAKIVVGEGIAGVKLGMTMAQVKTKLGPPTLDQGADFKGNTEWNYAKKPLMGAMSFDRHGKLLGLWTSSKGQKTSKGIGPGSSLAATRKAYPPARCKSGPWGPYTRVLCTLKSRYKGHIVEALFTFDALSGHTDSAHMQEVDIDFAEAG